MGGNLFGLGRLPRAEYLALEGRLRTYLDSKLKGHYRIPRYYGSKPDFGDVDIVVSGAILEETGQTWQELRASILTDLSITRSQSAGAVFSTVYEDFQVDYFLRPARYFQATYTFLCFNDLGNLLGKICRRMNLKYGERGLQYVYRRADDSYKRDIDVCLDIARICEFLGLDHAHWQAGFETLEEMYAWVIASPYFSVEPYRDPSRTMRARSRHRPTIKRFLAWLEENSIDKVCDYPPREAWLPRIVEAFPEARLQEIIAEEQAREARVVAVRQRFGGKRVMLLIPELTGKRLGEFIKTFKDGFADFEWEVSQMEPAEVDRRVLAHWARFKSS